MSLDIRKLELQLAQVSVARMSNEVKVEELLEAIARINADIKVSKDKEIEIQKLIKEKRGNK